jgi:hypothetical protein
MPQSDSPPTILLMDSDLGFMFALSQELGQRRIAAFPSRTVTEAKSLREQFQLQLAALVVDCSRGQACAFADGIARQHPGVQIVAIVSDRHRCSQCAGRVAAEFRDPEDRAPERIGHVADVIEMLVRKQLRHARRAGTSR